MEPRRTTLADIAQRAGVHVTTVSLAMRQHPKIPTGTRNRICRLAAEMGYRPDPILQALTAYRSRTMPRKPPTLAYLSDQPQQVGTAATSTAIWFAGAKTRAFDLGFNLEHVRTRNPAAHDLHVIDTLLARRIGGLIIADVASLELESRPDWTHLSAVKIGHAPARPPVHRVMSDDYAIIRMAMARAIAAGYRRIGLVMPQSWKDQAENRWVAGYLVAQANLALADRIPALLFPDSAHLPDESAVPPELLARWFRTSRPDVIISKASFIRAALTGLGLRVPRDVAFIDLFLEDTSGRTAGVRHNHAEVGAFAVETLAGMIERKGFGVPSSAATTFIAGVWCDGVSCPPRSAGKTKEPRA